MLKPVTNSNGFSHHFILPVIAIFSVAAIGVSMLRLSNAATPLCSATTLKAGQTSACAKYAAEMLNAITGTGENVTVSSKYTTTTEAKTTRFQQTTGLTASGIIDKATWTRLCIGAKTSAPRSYKNAGCAIHTPSYKKSGVIVGCGTMQGGTTDGTYLYYLCRHPSRNGEVNIVKYTTSGKKVATSSAFSRKQLGHANDMTYNKKLNLLVVSAWDDTEKGNNGITNKVRLIDPSSFKIKSTKTLGSYLDSKGKTKKSSSSNICYEATRDVYVSHGKIYDATFKYVKTIYSDSAVSSDLGITKEKDVLSQGIDCDSSYVYVIRVVYGQTGYNMIAAYNWDGKYVGAYRINLNDEAENLSMIDGIPYVGINEGKESSGGTSTKDYFIKLAPVSLE